MTAGSIIVTPASPSPVVVVEGLSRRYGSVTALDDVGFEVPAGARVALLGANGAGKSTLLATLCTLAPPRVGRVTIAGHDVARAGGEVRRRIGVLAHQPMVYEDLTSLENLRFFARLYGLLDANARIEELLRAVGLWRRRDEPARVLSRGYHQRLAMARALVHQPSVLLLDEPETGLDTDALTLLDDLMLRAAGITVLAATHRRDRVDDWSTGVLVLERGRIIEDSVSPPTPAAPRALAGAHA
ncbi:MAG: ABC transporter ATP-binding protein [Dehalococcoidia bacterium]|nr:ABC transporter ATP-binding protein [Dehalococcoidia bacterium]